MDTEAHRFEMANNELAELDGTPVGFDTQDTSDIKLYDVKRDKMEDHPHRDTRDSGNIKQSDTREMGDGNAVFEEPKTMLADEMKARAIDKSVIRASTGAGSVTLSRWTDKKDQEQGATNERKTDDEVPPRAPPARSQTTWTTWTTDSDVDLAGFPLAVMNPISPVSPLSPSEPKPPNG